MNSNNAGKAGTKRVALYARISDIDKGQETRNQLLQLRKYCKDRTWTIVHEYIDHASGKRSDNRKQFQALFAAGSQRDFDLVLFWSLDRFSREGALETMQHLQRLNSYGVDWKSYTEEYLDSCGIFKEAVLSILATIAKQERIRISERTKAGLARVRAEGRALGRPTKDVDLKQARALRRKGRSFRQIATTMGVCPATVLHRLAG